MSIAEMKSEMVQLLIKMPDEMVPKVLEQVKELVKANGEFLNKLDN